MQISTNYNYLNYIKSILDKGNSHQPREMATLEVINTGLNIDMNFPVVSLPQRKLNYKFMMAECLTIISGDNRVEPLDKVCKKLRDFSDNGIFYNGAYGPMVIEQLSYICDCLINDDQSRQALLTIWRQNPRSSVDIPCTISLQFLIRNNKINVIDTMRSSDAWLGIPYDLFNMSIIGYYILLLIEEISGIRYELGNLHMNLGSGHIYKRNLDLVYRLLENCEEEIYDPLHFSNRHELFKYLRNGVENGNWRKD